MSPAEQKAYRDGYAAGFKAATLVNHDNPDAKEEERRRNISIINSFNDNVSIQKIIDAISRED